MIQNSFNSCTMLENIYLKLVDYMVTCVLGIFFSLFLYSITGLTWILVIAFWVSTVILQVAYAHRLNALLGGVDPVAKFGARNLSQLKNIIHIPFLISTLRFLAKVMGWAGFVQLIISLGWLKKYIV